MTRILLLVTLVMVVPFAVGRGQQPMSKRSLVGVWTGVSATIDGRPLPEETVKQLRLTLTTDRYKSERGDQVLFDSSYTVDAMKNPPHIDMIGTEGDLKGKAAPGIFKLDGDTLTLCYVMAGKQRPARFVSEPQSGTFLVVYNRSDSK